MHSTASVAESPTTSVTTTNPWILNLIGWLKEEEEKRRRNRTEPNQRPTELCARRAPTRTPLRQATQHRTSPPHPTPIQQWQLTHNTQRPRTLSPPPRRQSFPCPRDTTPTSSSASFRSSLARFFWVFTERAGGSAWAGTATQTRALRLCLSPFGSPDRPGRFDLTPISPFVKRVHVLRNPLINLWSRRNGARSILHLRMEKERARDATRLRHLHPAHDHPTTAPATICSAAAGVLLCRGGSGGGEGCYGRGSGGGTTSVSTCLRSKG